MNQIAIKMKLLGYHKHGAIVEYVLNRGNYKENVDLYSIFLNLNTILRFEDNLTAQRQLNRCLTRKVKNTNINKGDYFYLVISENDDGFKLIITKDI